MRYSYGCYISEYRSLDNLMDDFDSIVESFFNENNNFSALLEADGDNNKQGLIDTIKEKFNKLIEFAKKTLIPKIKDIFAATKGKLVSIGGSIDNILKSGKLILGKDVNITKADVMVNALSKYDNMINTFVSISDNNFDKLDDLKQQENDIDKMLKDPKNRYTAKANDKVNPIEITKIKNNLPKVEDAKNKLEGRLNGEVAEIDKLYRTAAVKSDDAKKIYELASFGIAILRSSVSTVSRYILDANALINSLQAKDNKKENTNNKQA